MTPTGWLWLGAALAGALLAFTLAVVLARLGRANPTLRRLALFLGGQGLLTAMLGLAAVDAEVPRALGQLLYALLAGAVALVLWTALGLAFSTLRKARVYEAAAKTALADGRLSGDERALLDRLSAELLLSPRQATEIEQRLGSAPSRVAAAAPHPAEEGPSQR